MASAKPDEFGRYRVTNAAGHEYSTFRYQRDAHKIAAGPASDELGRAVPPVHKGEPKPGVAPKSTAKKAAASTTQDPPEQADPADNTEANKEA